MGKLVAYGKNLLLKPVKGKDKTDGGIVLPDSAQESMNCGVVVDVSLAVQRIRGSVSRSADTVDIDDYPSVGDKVYYQGYGANKIEHGGEEYVAVALGSVLAVEKA